MIKKTLTVFFILLANFILLAHAFIPHHHYQNKVCLATIHCKANSEAKTNSFPNSNEEHNTDNTPENCILIQLVVISDHQENNDFKCSFNTYNSSKTTNFHILFFENILTPYFHPSISRTSLPSLILHYSSFCNTSFGLRGPPMV